MKLLELNFFVRKTFFYILRANQLGKIVFTARQFARLLMKPLLETSEFPLYQHSLDGPSLCLYVSREHGLAEQQTRASKTLHWNAKK